MSNSEQKTLIEQSTEIQKIIEWVGENHAHHFGCARIEFNVATQELNEYEDGSECEDGNYPYVNSQKLIAFLKNLEQDA